MVKSKLNPNNIFYEKYDADIRDLYRLVLLYGCFSGSDVDRGLFPLLKRGDGKSFIRKSVVSTRLSQLSALLPSDFLKSTDGKIKNYYVENNLYKNLDDVMMKTYKMHNITDKQLLCYFMLLQSAQDYMEEYELDYFTLNDLAYHILDKYENYKGTNYQLSPLLQQTIEIIKNASDYDKLRQQRVIFNDMLDSGFFKELNIKEGDGSNSQHYTISEDKLDLLSDEQLEQLYNLLDYLSHTAIIKAPYYLTKEKIKLYQKISGRYSDNTIEKILYRHNYIYSILDDEIALQLIQAINAKVACSITYKQTTADYSSDDEYEENTTIIMPLKIINNSLDGRQYLFGYIEQSKLPISLRLDYILNIEEVQHIVLNKAISVKLLYELQHHVWTSSTYNWGKLTELKLQFKFSKNNRLLRNYIQYALDFFNTIENKSTQSEYNFVLQAELFDTMEIKPYLLVFGNHVSILSTNQQSLDLKQSLEEERKEILAKYETL